MALWFSSKWTPSLVERNPRNHHLPSLAAHIDIVFRDATLHMANWMEMVGWAARPPITLSMWSFGKILWFFDNFSIGFVSDSMGMLCEQWGTWHDICVKMAPTSPTPILKCPATDLYKCIIYIYYTCKYNIMIIFKYINIQIIIIIYL